MLGRELQLSNLPTMGDVFHSESFKKKKTLSHSTFQNQTYLKIG